MPIMWIHDGSPLTIAVEVDGEICDRMTVEGVDGKNAVWRVTELQDRRPANPVFDKGFRMREKDGEGKAVLKLEFRPEDDDEEDAPGR